MARITLTFFNAEIINVCKFEYDNIEAGGKGSYFLTQRYGEITENTEK